MILVIDACVFVKAITEEPGSEEAMQLIASPMQKLAPDFIRFEVAPHLRRR